MSLRDLSLEEVGSPPLEGCLRGLFSSAGVEQVKPKAMRLSSSVTPLSAFLLFVDVVALSRLLDISVQT